MRLLLPTDLSEAGLLAVRGLCDVPPQPFERIVLLHVIDLDLYTAGGSLPEIQEWASSELAREAERLRERGFEADARVEVGPTVDTIEQVAVEERSELVMVTSVGRNALTRRLLGSTAEALAAGSRLPVLVDRLEVREEEVCRFGFGSPFARPLVALDLTEPVPEVMRRVASLPGVRSVHVVHVEEDGAARHRADERLEDVLSIATSDLTVMRAVRHGEPVKQVLEEAESSGATLIVVFPKASGVDRLLRGSVSSGLGSRASVPVLFLPREGGMG